MAARLWTLCLLLALPASSFNPAARSPSRHLHTSRWGPPSTVVTSALLDARGNPIVLDDSSEEGAPEKGKQDEYDQALGMLVFGSGDPTMEIARRIDFYDEDFVDWLNERADASTDLEEREALKSLGQMVLDVREKYFETIAKAEAGEFESGPAGSAADDTAAPEDLSEAFADVPMARLDANGNAVIPGADDDDSPAAATVLDAMKEVQMGGGAVADAAAQDAVREEEEKEKKRKEAEMAARTTYVQLLASFLPLEGAELTKKVQEDFLRCDFTFMKVCEDVLVSDPDVAPKVQLVMEEVNKEASKRIEKAAAVVQQVLTAGSPGLMETEITKLCKQGVVDFAVLDLLDANIQAATSAGAAEPAEVMRKVRARAALELDKLKDPEQRLVSQLLKTPDSDARKALLQDAFEPKEKLMLSLTADDPGSDAKEDPMPDVSPDTFIEMVKMMIQNFGNLASTEVEGEALRDKLLAISQEAEQVSTSIYGESMTAREQQDRAWADSTVSVWDLETMEQQGEIEGETMPWDGDVDEQVFIDKMRGPVGGGGPGGGFNEKGVKQIGGY